MLDKIIFFLYVVRCGSFSEAAKQYGISSSAGSRWILELEEDLGVNLLKRTTRKVSPTQAGIQLYDQFSPIYKELNDVLDEIQNIGKETKGLIRVAATPLFAKLYLGSIIGTFLQDYPKIRFKIYSTPFDVDFIDQVDFAIRAEVSYTGKIDKDSLLIKRKLIKEPLYLCASPLYLNKTNRPIHPEELNQHNCLYASTLVGGNRWMFEKESIFTAVEISQTVEIDDSEILRSIALSGGGIAYLPKSLIQKDFDSGALIQLLPDYQCGEFEFSLYFKPRKQMPARCENFKNYLTTQTPLIHAQLKP